MSQINVVELMPTASMRPLSGKPPSASSASSASSYVASTAAAVAMVNVSADVLVTAMDVPADENEDLLTGNDDTILAACNFNDGCLY